YPEQNQTGTEWKKVLKKRKRVSRAQTDSKTMEKDIQSRRRQQENTEGYPKDRAVRDWKVIMLLRWHR
ncbi:hypothetical protein NPIL_364481, partial [Nephila pilipes]